MTVKELIEKLKQCPEDAEVYREIPLGLVPISKHSNILYKLTDDKFSQDMEISYKEFAQKLQYDMMEKSGEFIVWI